VTKSHVPVVAAGGVQKAKGMTRLLTNLKTQRIAIAANVRSGTKRTTLARKSERSVRSPRQKMRALGHDPVDAVAAAAAAAARKRKKPPPRGQRMTIRC
jgi:hypothetical protein